MFPVQRSPKLPQSLDKILTPLIKPVVRRRGLAQADIVLKWEKIVHHMADYCIPIKLSFPRGKTTEGTLHLWVDSGSALQLEYAKDLIISCINGYFGYNAVAFLKFQQTSLKSLKKSQLQPHKPSSPKPLTQQINCTVQEVGSERLHAALKNLGEVMGCKMTEE